MAIANSNLTILGYKTGIASGGEQLGPLTINNNTPVDAVSTQALSSGDNTLDVPSGALSAIIIPPTGNVIVLTLKGNAADVGIVISPVNPTVLSLTDATFILNVSAGVTLVIAWY